MIKNKQNTTKADIFNLNRNASSCQKAIFSLLISFN